MFTAKTYTFQRRSFACSFIFGGSGLGGAGFPLLAEFGVWAVDVLENGWMCLDDVMFRGVRFGEHGVDDAHAEADIEDPSAGC